VDPQVADVERWMEALYVAAEGATLRREDRRKAVEVAALLRELGRAVQRTSKHDELVLVDAAAGKAYVALLAWALVLRPAGRRARVVTIERDAARVEATRRAAALLGPGPVPLSAVSADVRDAAAWPEEASIVTALHACGPATDAIIDRAIASRARTLLIVPCCTGTGAGTARARAAEQAAKALGIPRHAPVRRRFHQAFVDAERTLRLEAAGYETEVVELCGATVTPENLLWRARRVGEPGRVASARRDLRLMQADPHAVGGTF
jgi:Methyltransferase domain